MTYKKQHLRLPLDSSRFASVNFTRKKGQHIEPWLYKCLFLKLKQWNKVYQRQDTFEGTHGHLYQCEGMTIGWGSNAFGFKPDEYGGTSKVQLTRTLKEEKLY